MVVVKCRLAVNETLSARLRSPVEICRIRDEAMPDEFGELTLIPVEFLFADRQGICCLRFLLHLSLVKMKIK